ncbi:MAG: hypothetical protein FWH08_07270 [Oscillospiraceae bacterium]|nr:hypothetical protein [Oscillospiraceae bacterium]
MEDPLINNPISGTIIWGTDISGAFFSGDWNSFAYGMGGATVLGLEVYAGAEVANKVSANYIGNRTTVQYNVSNKISKQMSSRGWTSSTMDRVIQNPHTTRVAINKATGNNATAYYNKAGDYIVRDNITSQIIQISKLGDKNWIPDSSIINPYIPK